MAIAAWVDVVNAALIKLGAATITTLDNADNPKAGRLGALRYEACRDAVLRLHPWNSVTKRVSTANLTTPVPEIDYDYFHLQPSNCLRILNVGPEGTDYRIQGRYIATNETALELRYIAREEDVTIIDSLLLEAIATYLAWDLCTALQQNGEIKKELWDQFRQIIAQAKSVDGKEEPMQEIEAETWLNARLGGGGFDRSMNWAN